MRRIIRKSLSEATSGKLDELGQRVAEAESPKAMAMAAWDAKPKREFAEIRRVLAEMAQGRARCMYLAQGGLSASNSPVVGRNCSVWAQ